jgi:hypothetical protein
MMKTLLAKPGDLQKEKDQSQQKMTSKTRFVSAAQSPSVMPLYLRNQSVLSLAITNSLVPRTILVSGGQTITVYGKFPTVVETALADGWLSFREMDALWKSGQHMGGGGKDPHQMMEMLTQRALPPVKGVYDEISGLSESEKLNWEGTGGKAGIKALGSLSREGGKGMKVTRFEHYLTEQPAFESYKKEAREAGVRLHVYNLQRYLNAIDAEATLAPDDKAMFRRLAFLHYIMRYPDPSLRYVELPSPTPAQSSRYNKLWHRSPPDFIHLEEMAVGMGLPDTL